MFEYTTPTEVKVRADFGKYHISNCSAKLINTMGDCSTISVGHYYCTDIKAAHVFMHYLLRQRSAERKPEGYRWKFVLTDSAHNFESGSAKHLRAVLDEICADSHVVEVNGWEGDKFEIRVWEIEKGWKWMTAPELPAKYEAYVASTYRDGHTHKETVKVLDDADVYGNDHPTADEDW